MTNNSAGSYEPAITTDANRLHVVWMDSRDGNWEIYYKRGTFTPFPPNLQNVIVYPNPYIASKHDKVYFKEITEHSVIKIFTLAGELVKEIKVSKTPQEWDLKNEAGILVASGIYIYLITDTQGNKATGKIGVIK